MSNEVFPEEEFHCHIESFKFRDDFEGRCRFCQVNINNNDHQALYGYCMLISIVCLVVVGVILLSLKEFK